MTDRPISAPPLAMMHEATRLTREGRLGEAAELLRRSLADAPPGAHASAVAHAALLPDGLRDRVQGLIRNLRSAAPALKGFVGGLPGLNGLEPAPSGPSDERFVERHFANAAGARDYRLFIPGSASGPRPLVVMLHGCTQTPEDFAAGTRMNVLGEEEGIYVVYPRQNRSANPQGCWNWFQPGDQGREMGEAGIVAGIVREVIAEFPIDPARVYIAGLSAGGAAAANIARAYPDLFAAVCVHSGLAAGCARDLPSALSAMRVGAPGAAPEGGAAGFGAAAAVATTRVPTIVFHGEGDSTVSPRNADEVLAQAGVANLTPQAETGSHGVGHPYTRTRYTDAAGEVRAEAWIVRGVGHAWSGGSSKGSYTDPHGPDASRAMLDFFLSQRLTGRKN